MTGRHHVGGRHRGDPDHPYARHAAGAVLGLLVAVVVATGALAYWSTTGSGSATASAATLAAPTSVTVSSYGSTVTVGFTGVTPPGGVLTGYYVTRYLGATASNACGTVPGTTSSYLAAGATGCTDTGVPNGTYTYVVTAAFNSWTAPSTASASIAVNSDVTPPTQALSLAGTSTAYLTGSTLYFGAAAAGSFTLDDAVSDSGSGPGSATFPAVTAAGWSHAAETVTTGTGSAPTITYPSSTFSWGVAPGTPSAYTVTGKDVAGNSVTTTLTFVPDVTAPTGGALTVNGGAATSAGSVTYSRTGTYTLARTDFSADTGSGLAGSVLTRAVGTLSNGVCSGYAAPTTLTGAPSETGLAAGCYRYTLTGTDHVGNAAVLSTVVEVDKTAPTQAFSETGTSSSITGTTLYYRSTAAGSLQLTDTLTDAGTGPSQVTFPAAGSNGWTHTAETVTTGTGANPTIAYTAANTYSWTAGATSPPAAARTFTGADVAGNTGTATLTFTADNTAPTGGALTANGTAASTAGTTSVNASGAYALSRTDYTDAGSGIASSVLTRQSASLVNGVCGTYGAATTLTGAPAESGLTTGCYRYTLTGTDNVGNVATPISTVVEVDTTAPTQVLSLGGGATNAVLSGTTLYFKPTAAGSFTLDDAVTDGETGPAQALFPAIGTTGWTHNAQTVTTGTGTVPTKTYASSTFSWTAGASTPSGYAVTGSDVAGNGVATPLTFTPDTTGPTGGALTVAGVAGTSGGATTYTSTGTYTGSYTAYSADAGAGYQGTTLTRAYAPTLTNGVCGTYGAATTITSVNESGLAAGCYRYTLTGSDLLGNTSTLSVVVEVDKTAPTVTLSANSTNAYVSGTTLYYNSAVAGSLTLNAAVTDGQAGPAQAAFAAAASNGWTHTAETITTGSGGNPTTTYTSSTYSWTAGATSPPAAARTVTGYDLAGNTVASTLTFTADTTAPTGGALTVNGVAATAAGSTSSTNGTSWTIGTRTDYSADTGSGLASSVLTVATATWNGTTCGTYGAPVTIAGAPTQTGVGGSCYRYVLTGTDNVGNVSSLTTVVRTGISITSVTLNNSATGTAGTVNRLDTIVVQYSGPMSVSSMCSTWSGDTTNQSITANNVVGVTISNGGTANDYMTVSTTSAACGGAFHFGTLTLGSTGYLVSTASQTFSGSGAGNASTIAWNASTYTLTITLGTNATTPGDDGSNNVPGNTVAVYTPDPAILGTTGLPVSGTGSTASGEQF